MNQFMNSYNVNKTDDSDEDDAEEQLTYTPHSVVQDIYDGVKKILIYEKYERMLSSGIIIGANGINDNINQDDDIANTESISFPLFSIDTENDNLQLSQNKNTERSSNVNSNILMNDMIGTSQFGHIMQSSGNGISSRNLKDRMQNMNLFGNNENGFNINDSK